MRGQDGVSLPWGLNVGDPHLDPSEQGHLGQEVESFCWFKQKIDGKNKLLCSLRGDRSLLRTKSGSGELFVVVTFGEQEPFSDQAWPCLPNQGLLLEKMAPTLLCGQIQAHSGSGHCSRQEKMTAEVLLQRTEMAIPVWGGTRAPRSRWAGHEETHFSTRGSPGDGHRRKAPALPTAHISHIWAVPGGAGRAPASGTRKHKTEGFYQGARGVLWKDSGFVRLVVQPRGTPSFHASMGAAAI